MAKSSGLYSETREGRPDRLCERNTEVTVSVGNVSVVCAVMVSFMFAGESPLLWVIFISLLSVRKICICNYMLFGEEY